MMHSFSSAALFTIPFKFRTHELHDLDDEVMSADTYFELCDFYGENTNIESYNVPYIHCYASFKDDKHAI
jgi:hypothetical protein